MRYLSISDEPTTNTFPPVKVIGKMKPDGDYNDDVLQLWDAQTGKIVLEVGTGNTDEYYPWWVGNFSPQNMACNQKL